MKLVNLVFKTLVAANLVALNLVFYGAYKTVLAKLMLFQADVALQVEERLTEEFGYITKDMEAIPCRMVSACSCQSFRCLDA